jgi:NADPH2:quinone reductase
MRRQDSGSVRDGAAGSCRGEGGLMRAWQVASHGEPADVLRAVELDEPTPEAGHVRVRVEAAAVGMPDVMMCRGVYPMTPPLPFVAGQEVCGVVDAVGDGVALPVGSRVMGVTTFYDGRGGFAEATILQEATAFRVPDGMPAVDAAAFRIGYSTAWVGLVRRGQLAAGEPLVVLGAAGGSGITAVQLGAALGARVVAVAAGEDKLAFCRSAGASAVVDRRAGSVTEAILEATDGRGADLVYDPVGGSLAGDAARAMATGGRFLAVGFASGEWVHVDTHELVIRNQSLVGVFAGGPTREENEADHEALLALHAEGKLTPFTTAVGLEDLPSALTAVADGSAVGKLVVEVA